MAASRLKFNRHRQTTETLPALTMIIPPHVTELGYSDKLTLNYNRSDKATQGARPFEYQLRPIYPSSRVISYCFLIGIPF